MQSFAIQLRSYWYFKVAYSQKQSLQQNVVNCKQTILGESISYMCITLKIDKIYLCLHVSALQRHFYFLAVLYNQETITSLQNNVLLKPICVITTDFPPTPFFFSPLPVLSTIQHVPNHQGPAGAADTDPAGQHPVAAGGAPEDTGAALPGPRLQCTGVLLLEGAESSILSHVTVDRLGNLNLLQSPGYLDKWKLTHLNEDVAF